MRTLTLTLLICLPLHAFAQAAPDVRSIIQNEENRSLNKITEYDRSDTSTVPGIEGIGLEAVSEDTCLQTSDISIDESLLTLKELVNTSIAGHDCITIGILRQTLLSINQDLRYRGLVTTGFSGVQWIDGRLVLLGVEGYVEDIIAPAKIAERLSLTKNWQRKKFNILHLDELMERLSKYGDYVADVEPGNTKGGSIITITGRNDSKRSVKFGGEMAHRDQNFSVAVNVHGANLFQEADRVILQHYVSPKDAGTGVALTSLGYDFLLGDALDLSMSYAVSKQISAVNTSLITGLKNEVTRSEASTKLRRTLWQRSNRRWSIEIGVGQVKSENRFDDLNLDIAQENRLTLDVSNELQYSSPYLSMKAVLGVRRGLDNSGRDQNFKDFKRRNFTKVDFAVLGNVYTSQRGDEYLSGMLRLVSANENLPADEALRIGGHSSVRGLANQSYSTHQGQYLRFAWNKRWSQPASNGLWYSIGVDYGKGRQIGTNQMGLRLSSLTLSTSWSSNSLRFDIAAAVPLRSSNALRHKTYLEGSMRYSF